MPLVPYAGKRCHSRVNAKNPSSDFWTADKLDRLKGLAGQGLSASLIATQLGCTRSSVIGKLHRGKGKYGRLTGQLRQPQAMRARSEAKPARPAPRLLPAPPLAVKRVPVAPPPPPVYLPAVPPIGFLDAVDRGRCLYFADDPMSAPGPEMPVCGAERHELSRYCLRHVRRAYAHA